MLNSLLEEMEGDARAPQQTPAERLKALVPLVKTMQERKSEVDRLEEELKLANEALRYVSEVQIPDLFDELGLEEIKVEGKKVTVTRGYAASITQETAPVAFKWLRDNGHGEIIKHTVAVELKKGEEESHEKLVKFLSESGQTYSDKEAVHPQTLKAFVTEQMKTPGVELPQDVFHVFPLRQTKIK
jgi:hypothetical protein